MNKLNVDFTKYFKFSRGVGVCLLLVAVYKTYIIIDRYTPGMMYPIRKGEIFGLVVCVCIALYALTIYWRITITKDQIDTYYGSLFYRKHKVFKGLDNIAIKVGFTERNNGPSKAYVHVLIKPRDRARPYSLYSLHQVRESIVVPGMMKRKHQSEISQFNSDVNKLLSMFPELSLEIDDKVTNFYTSITEQPAPWGDRILVA